MFTIHRAIIIYKPYSELHHDSKRLAWIVVGVITAIAAFSNSWVSFLAFTEIA
jgi:hypothetical protein